MYPRTGPRAWIPSKPSGRSKELLKAHPRAVELLDGQAQENAAAREQREPAAFDRPQPVAGDVVAVRGRAQVRLFAGGDDHARGRLGEEQHVGPEAPRQLEVAAQ